MKQHLMKWIAGMALGAAAITSSSVAFAQEQFVPILSYRVGPYAAGGSGFFGGVIDYFNLVNASGGINGVKLSWEECETEYNASRGVECYERLKKRSGGASMVEPLSTGIAYGILDRVATDKIPMTTLGYGNSAAADGRVFQWVFPLITTYWSQAAGMIQYLADKEGGYAKLKGKKIVHLYHDSAFGKEPFPVFDALSAQHGFELLKIAVPHPGNDQQSQWLQIRQAKPDYVILWGWGVMNPTALKAAQRAGYPREKMLGVWWAGSEEDVIPAGDAAKNYVTTTFTPSGNYPVVDEIRKKVYGANKGNLDDKSRIGSIYHLRGISDAIMIVEAMRNAQAKFGKGKVLSAEQIRWGMENINLDDARLKQLGASGMMPTVKTSCMDHEGSGLIKVQRWDGNKWNPITKDWISGDKAMIRKMVETSASQYAAEKNIKPGCL
jgi:branched-chain amino acid transport system substrate-binding protein